MITASVTAPAITRIAVKLAASMWPSPSASRHSRELPANASIANTVRSAVRPCRKSVFNTQASVLQVVFGELFAIAHDDVGIEFIVAVAVKAQAAEVQGIFFQLY